MKTKPLLLRVGIGAAVALILVIIFYPVYLRHSWENTRHELAALAEKEALPGEISVILHIPKLTIAELKALEETRSYINEKYYDQRLAKLYIALHSPYKTRSESNKLQLKIFGINYIQEEAAIYLRFTLSSTRTQQSVLEECALEIEARLSAATAQIPGTRLTLKKGA